MNTMIKQSASKGAGQGASKSDTRSTKKSVKKTTARTGAKSTAKRNTARQNTAKKSTARKSTAKNVGKRAGTQPVAASPSPAAAGPGMPDRLEIERRAYALYAARHHADGNDVEDWLEAERQLRGEALAAMAAAARATTTVPEAAPVAKGRRAADGPRPTRTTGAGGTGARRPRKN
jgi:hypothetical protein